MDKKRKRKYLLYERALMQLLEYDKGTLDRLFEFMLQALKILGYKVFNKAFYNTLKRFSEGRLDSVEIFETFWYFITVKVIHDVLKVKELDDYWPLLDLDYLNPDFQFSYDSFERYGLSEEKGADVIKKLNILMKKFNDIR